LKGFACMGVWSSCSIDHMHCLYNCTSSGGQICFEGKLRGGMIILKKGNGLQDDTYRPRHARHMSWLGDKLRGVAPDFSADFVRMIVDRPNIQNILAMQSYSDCRAWAEWSITMALVFVVTAATLAFFSSQLRSLAGIIYETQIHNHDGELQWFKGWVLMAVKHTWVVQQSLEIFRIILATRYCALPSSQSKSVDSLSTITQHLQPWKT
jgi:hypothetical protein